MGESATIDGNAGIREPKAAPAYLAGLNPAQRHAVEYGGAGEHGSGVFDPPLLIIAGAGSGKTNTLAHRVAHLIVSGADPRRMMLLTFSRRAATEMQRRVERITAKVLGPAAGAMTDALAWSGTFHAIGARLLREYATDLGIDVDFTIHDREDSADLMNLVRHDLGFSKTVKRFPTKHTCLSIYSRAVNATSPLGEVLGTFFPWCAEWESELQSLFAAYVATKQKQNVLDYDDLLLYWAHMMMEPALAGQLSDRFDHVMVDEYQDTNRLQSSILLNFKPTGQGLTVVGDDAQSIYSFRAATVRNILDFPAHFSPPAALITLEQNYRSTQPILAAANAVIDLASERFTKNLWSNRASGDLPALVSVADDNAQAGYVADCVLANREAGLRLKAQAVLFRTSSHSATLEVELTRRNIPFVKFGGLKFLESAHIKDLLALLRWSQNLRDRVAGFRVAQLLPGFGPGMAAKLLDAIEGGARPIRGLNAFRPPTAAAEHWIDFCATIKALHLGKAGWPADLDLASRWYVPLMQHRFDDAPQREGDIAQLAQIASSYPTRERFLTELTLDPPDATSDQAGPPLLDEDYLILSTIHSAKGQEWDSVFVLNAVDGCIPSDLGVGTTAEIDEERRLLYVAMTRAKDQLHLMLPQRFYVHGQRSMGDRHIYAQRTRFIPNALTHHFQSRSWPAAQANASLRRPISPLDVRGKLRGMWG
ncbi:DNA helicase II [Variibacter gotjawalensis]|uniref:DNA 3'-5' helicase n=1 Tax=Variibacter gotjawalensis TaxID=1333996 RepID=A0A0S3PRN4_9BRAD|nr:ATP-dependent helicase [Variibacter gotjawalensis]NIK48863.1 DNA helicase-2/ATP-dependent DNA helicase PcrA [Variibacter gotjawalensis]RZS50721.1 DNA helicase-2/ATP-dependent DNA helicase PcrA [Variibacter gotjawalensis]BAT58557.1 DNA helicase II [Variibacter gotjawalensis]